MNDTSDIDRMIKEAAVHAAFDALTKQHPDMDPDEIWTIVTDLYGASMTREATR